MTHEIVLWVWGALGAAAVACEAAAVTSRGRVAPLGEALGRLAAARWRMVACFVGWMWVGWHFFAR